MIPANMDEPGQWRRFVRALRREWAASKLTDAAAALTFYGNPRAVCFHPLHRGSGEPDHPAIASAGAGRRFGTGYTAGSGAHPAREAPGAHFAPGRWRVGLQWACRRRGMAAGGSRPRDPPQTRLRV